MRYQLLDRDETARPVGAAVVRSNGSEVVLDLGPADGAPSLRIPMTANEGLQLSRALQAVANGKIEEVLIVDD